MTDPLRRSLVFVSASDGGSFDPARRVVTWDLGTVPVGASDRLTLRARVRASTAAGTLILNEATYRATLTAATPAADLTTVT